MAPGEAPPPAAANHRGYIPTPRSSSTGPAVPAPVSRQPPDMDCSASPEGPGTVGDLPSCSRPPHSGAEAGAWGRCAPRRASERKAETEQPIARSLTGGVTRHRRSGPPPHRTALHNELLRIRLELGSGLYPTFCGNVVYSRLSSRSDSSVCGTPVPLTAEGPSGSRKVVRVHQSPDGLIASAGFPLPIIRKPPHPPRS
jgi:hypothetical protein